jgi:diadenosine tetraphosphate (Ap4A) HIT family hydrolase
MLHLPYMSPKYSLPIATCRFCTLPEPDRIVLETPNFVVLMGLGPLVIGYCLIITRRHYASYAELPRKYRPEFIEVVKAVQSTQQKVFGDSVLFEHGRNGGCLPRGHDDELCYHAHMHLLPTAANLAGAVSADYSFEVLPGLKYLSRTARGSSYLLVQDGNSVNCTVNPEALPPRYLRTKVAEQIPVDVALADWQAFPSYDMIYKGKEIMKPELDEAWQSRPGQGVQWSSRLRLPQFPLRKPAQRMIKSR